MFVFVNGFWEGFLEKKNAVHFGVFQTLLSNAFKEAIYPTTKYEEADILLESSFGDSALLYKKWTYSIFFSGNNC